MVNLTLNGDGNNITIKCIKAFAGTNSRYSEVFLNSNNESIRLGADILEIIVPALLNGINLDGKKKYFSYGGKKTYIP